MITLLQGGAAALGLLLLGKGQGVWVRKLVHPVNLESLSVKEYKAYCYQLIHYHPGVPEEIGKWPKSRIVDLVKRTWGQDWRIVAACISNESGFYPGAIAGYKGPNLPDSSPNSTAFGLGQQTRKWMPANASWPHICLWYPPAAIAVMRQHLDQVGFPHDPAAALQAYSYGLGTAKGKAYASKILAKAADPKFLADSRGSKAA